MTAAEAVAALALRWGMTAAEAVAALALWLGWLRWRCGLGGGKGGQEAVAWASACAGGDLRRCAAEERAWSAAPRAAPPSSMSDGSAGARN
jgi:hypothetical protein